MDFFEENKKKPSKTPAQKLVLSLLIISIILCIMIGIAIAYLSIKGETKPYTIALNGQNIELNKLQLITTQNGKNYISLRAISDNLKYDYYNGEFKIADETKTKGYINNKVNITQFFANKTEIYKTTENSTTDYEYYILDNPILSSEENLYIALDDLDVALNLILDYSEENNQTIIQTPEYWVEKNAETFSKSNITISNTAENMKALSYGYVIINKDNKYGVIDLRGQELIGNKYKSITFFEYTKKFISSNINNEFGIITHLGTSDIDLQYDSIEVINYNPLLYKVKELNKYGVLKEDGETLNNIEYDSIGYPENKNNKINYTLIIPNINENIPESIVVCNNNKYGLINLENGKEVISCNLDGIFSVTKDDKDYYIVESQGNKMFLENFIDNLNKVTVTID